MKRIIFLILAVILISGCEKKEDDNSNFSSINLMTDDSPSLFTKTVILFENNNYLIKTNLDKYISSYPFGVLDEYDDIKVQVIQDTNIDNVIVMTDYLHHPNDSNYILGYHLENGSCLIIDKKTNKTIPSIKMKVWGGSPSPLAGAGGRRFYIKNKLFLETTDWIS